MCSSSSITSISPRWAKYRNDGPIGARLSPEIIGAITDFTQPAPISRSVSSPADAAPTSVRFLTPLRMMARMIGIG